MAELEVAARRTVVRSPAPERKSLSSISSRDKRKKHHRKDTDSEDSEDESMDSEEHPDSQDSKSSPGKAHKAALKIGGDWEMLQGLRTGQRHEEKPKKQEGYLMKRRKWPMKGWHKRYFVLEKGILTYSKSPHDMFKGKYHGTIDIGLAVLAYKKYGRRIDIDAEDLIYHIKVKTVPQFDDWLAQFHQHRLYRQHELSFGSVDAPRLTDMSSTPVEDLTPVTSPVSPGPLTDLAARGSFKSRSMERNQSKVAAWLLDSHGLEHWNKELSSAQNKLFQLTTLLEKLKQSSPDGSTNGTTLNNVLEQSSEPYSTSSSVSSSTATNHLTTPSKKDKAGRKSGGKSNKKDRKNQDRLSQMGPAALQVPNSNGMHTSSSNPNLMSNDMDRVRPASMPDYFMQTITEHNSQDLKVREEYLHMAKAVHETLRVLSRSITTERERLKCALEQESNQAQQNNPNYVQALRQALSEALNQNHELRSKMSRIHAESSLSASQPSVPQVPSAGGAASVVQSDKEHPLLAASGSWESQSEFHDAAEYLQSSADSSEDEEEVSSDISDTEGTTAQTSDECPELKHLQTGRRSKLPQPKPNSDISLWGLLYRNIGKDLSKISMPVTLNEPLSLLQRVCEELEYSELVDKAAETDDPYERMVLITAFAVSPYAATYYRAGSKPFNPLLGETYECIREDRGWRFIGEQVSHHPPVSACYCESKNFLYWQDVKCKTKFWGKSMEAQPIGTVNLKIPQYKDHYMWNKVTTCVHNLLGGQRWVDHYGDVTITNQGNGITCKLTFTKSSYWSDKRHEVYGTITSPEGKVIHHVFGKWNEGIYYGHAPSAKCVWRPGSMPEDYHLYYGLTRFAIELNEIDSEQAHLYPPTDSRFRPDQRFLEEGNVKEAESSKHRLEQIQRERRKQRDDEKVTYSPRWFMKTDEDGKDTYMYTGKYWEMRKNPGFLQVSLPKIW